jgi:hypothetical protein
MFQENVNVKIVSSPSYAVKVARVPSGFHVNAIFVVLLPGGGLVRVINAL